MKEICAPTNICSFFHEQKGFTSKLEFFFFFFFFYRPHNIKEVIKRNISARSAVGPKLAGFKKLFAMLYKSGKLKQAFFLYETMTKGRHPMFKKREKVKFYYIIIKHLPEDPESNRKIKR